MSIQHFKFPFSAVAGQAELKLALVLAAIDPRLGGVLITGPRGSAKTTLARGLAEVLPDDPQFVNLPLGTSEEMLVGTLDLQQVLNEQKVSFRPGLLAKAHGGILYVDEVNLLQDNLVDLLLDVVTSGINLVERDGISHQHESEFVLLGTMNPDEGELRQQLLDRFGLSVKLGNDYSIEERVEIVRLRESFDSDPNVFLEKYQASQLDLKLKIKEARDQLAHIHCSEAMRIMISQRCHEAKVDGLRADIIWCRAAMAHAAWQNKEWVTEKDILETEELVLSHRRKITGSASESTPPVSPSPSTFSPPPSPSSKTKGFSNNFSEFVASNFDQRQLSVESEPSVGDSMDEGVMSDWGSMEPAHQSLSLGIPSFSKTLIFSQARLKSYFQNPDHKNTLVKSINPLDQYKQRVSSKINWFGSLIANFGNWPLQQIRYQKEKICKPKLHLILWDTSASTLQSESFAAAKAVIAEIGQQAYLDRQELMIFGVGNQSVEIILPRVRAPKSLNELLNKIPAAGGTPLREGLNVLYSTQKKISKINPDLDIRNYIITDGKITQSCAGLGLLGQSLLVDIECAGIKRGKGRVIAETLNADYFPLFESSKFAR